MNKTPGQLNLKRECAAIKDLEAWVRDHTDQNLGVNLDTNHATELFLAQETIAREVAQKLSLKLPNHQEQLPTKHRTRSNEAYLLYLTGRYHFNKLTPDGVKKGTEYFHQAIEMDSNYGLAYAGRVARRCSIQGTYAASRTPQ